jgi:FolB domain-containing protein
MSVLENLTLTCRKLSIIDYEVSLSIGVTPLERFVAQPVRISVDVWVPAPAALSDSLSSTYDYTKITRVIDETVTARSFCLQETLIELVAGKILADSSVRAIRIRSCKPKAIDKCAGAAVEIFRLNKN